MQDKEINRIVFCEDQYTYESDPQSKMWNDIKETMRILSFNGYDIRFYCDSSGIYVLEYNPRDLELGFPHLEWLDEDEYIEKYEEN